MILQVFVTSVIGLSSGYTFSSLPYREYSQSYFRPRALPDYRPNDIDRPVVHPQMGMSPEYHNIVYKYIAEFAGSEEPPSVQVEELGHREEGDEAANAEEGTTHVGNEEKPEGDAGANAGTHNPEASVFVMPSDLILFGKGSDPSRLSAALDGFALGKRNFEGAGLAKPPLGGVMSNYVLLRNRPDFRDFIAFAPSSGTDPAQPSKRQVPESDDADDTVVIVADPDAPHNVKMNEDGEDERRKDQSGSDGGGGGGDGDGDDDEEQPAIAQSKPAAIALAGPGGVAQASPVGTALVGPGGLAVAAPSGTAVAGPAGQGVLSPADDKAKLVQKKIKEAWN